MSNRWLVYREKETLGPFETHEVRAALRSGDLDPFDKVGLEGSSIQRPLLDIDEIFIVEEEAEQGGKQVEVVQQAAVSGSDVQQQFIQEADLQASSKTQIGQGYLGGAIEEIKDGNKDDVSEFVKKYKSYYVMSGNNIGGPYSYQKIVELYKKGTLPKDARVKKNGYSKSVPIRSFVKKNSSRKKSNSHSANIIALQNNKRRIVIVKKENKSILWIAIALIVASVAFAAVAIVNSGRFQQPAQSSQVNTKASATKTVAPKAKARVAPVIKKRAAARTSPIKVKRPRKTTAKSKRLYVKPPTRSVKKYTPKKTVRKPVVARRPTTTKRTVSKKVAQRAPVRRKTTVRKSPTISSSSLSSMPNLAGREGDEVIIGPLAFSASQLQSCENKCTLNFADRNAKSISVIFFKGAYLSKLLSKKGAATLQGTVSNGGNALILQKVR